ncbi:MAG: hypothetical protein KC484_02780 [Colwelliaceae bacterium]|jgi:hypothetical protein|nr:hypothetical protein [Colwelliaceae bacterium]
MDSEKIERRKSEDLWLKVIRIFTILAWLIFTVALVVSYYAAPETNYGVLRYHNISIRKFWLTPLTGYLYLLLWLSALLSYVSLIVHKYRSRRRSDNKRFNVILLFSISLAWVIYIVINMI